MTSQAREPENSAAMTPREQERRANAPDLMDSGLLFARTTQLACEGAVSLMLKTSVRELWDQLVHAASSGRTNSRACLNIGERGAPANARNVRSGRRLAPACPEGMR